MKIKERIPVQLTHGHGTADCFFLEDWESGEEPGEIIRGMQSTRSDGSYRINILMLVECLTPGEQERVAAHLAERAKYRDENECKCTNCGTLVRKDRRCFQCNAVPN